MQSVQGWNHVYRRSNGALYYVRRVPRDLTDLIADRQFKRSLRHRDERLAAFKAAYDSVHREVETYICQLRQGASAPAARRDFELAVVRARRMGFDLRPMSELADQATCIEDLIERLIAVEGKIEDKADPVPDVVLGAVTAPTYSLEDAVKIYVDLNKTELKDKNADQQKRWRAPLDLAVRNFTDLIGARDLKTITRDDALRFREWWVKRITEGETSTNTANKSLIALRKVFRIVNETYRLGLENPLDGMRVKEKPAARKVSLDRAWLEGTLLTHAALARLNAEARGIVHIMADTGARLNEIAGLAPEDVHIDHPTPHILIRPNSIRSLKTAQSERSIPLVGTALAAMKEHSKGFPRYAGKNATASAAINKYLKDNNLLPDGATLYSLRHGFQDRLIEIEAPERIQADLIGHKTLRPKYGKGPSLEQMRDWLRKTALRPEPE